MKILLISIGLVCLAAEIRPETPLSTLRLDFYHSGNATTELYSLDEVTLEPLPWAGNPDRPMDETNLGHYLFEVRDRVTNRLLYSRGFSSIYGEWQTTAEAKRLNRTFHESLRFPAPAAPVQVLVKKRDAANDFREVWSLIVDPSDIFINRAKGSTPAPLLEIERHGDPSHKVDLLIMGDGYTASETAKFEADARRLAEALLTASPFKERRSDFNVWGLCPPSVESGVSRPSTGQYRDTPIGATYDAFGSERYILTFDNKAFRSIAARAPYDVVEILVNERTYGGGGIFGLYGTVAADSAQAPYVFVHEFGHHFTALADEYYTSDVAYLPPETKIEPWEPNVTALLDAANLKWRDMVVDGVPLPTPWQKETFEKHSNEYQARRRQIRSENRPEDEMEALFKENRDFEISLFAAEPYVGKVGAFEGANYEATGYYRPEVECIMFTRSPKFCAVCRRAIERMIDVYTAR